MLKQIIFVGKVSYGKTKIRHCIVVFLPKEKNNNTETDSVYWIKIVD